MLQHILLNYFDCLIFTVAKILLLGMFFSFNFCFIFLSFNISFVDSVCPWSSKIYQRKITTDLPAIQDVRENDF